MNLLCPIAIEWTERKHRGKAGEEKTGQAVAYVLLAPKSEPTYPRLLTHAVAGRGSDGNASELGSAQAYGTTRPCTTCWTTTPTKSWYVDRSPRLPLPLRNRRRMVSLAKKKPKKDAPTPTTPKSSTM